MYQDRLLGEADQPLVPTTGGSPAALSPLERVSRSIPGAIAGVVLMSALAFGAGAVHAPGTSEPAGYTGAHGDRPSTNGGAEYGGVFPGGSTSYPIADLDGAVTGDGDGLANGDGQGTDATGDPNGEPAGQPDGDAKDGAAPDPTDKAEPTPKPEPKTEPTPKPTPKPEPKTEPTPKPEPDPTATPKPQTMALALGLGSGYVKVDWTGCEADFDYYKVVRSADSTVRWPLGAYDTLVAAIPAGGETAVADTHAPADRTVWYRVFCVRSTSSGYEVLNSTPARSIHTPVAPEPTPAPQTMGLELSLGDGGVVVDWTVCEADGFDYYKVVRSSDSTVTWPTGYNDSLIWYTSDRSVTSFVDTSVDPGKTYFYRVFCVRATSYGYQVLNSTPAHDITVPEPDPTATPVEPTPGP
jgi:hypothetical protein